MQGEEDNSFLLSSLCSSLFPLIILSIKKWSNKFFHELQPFSIRLYCLDFFKNRRKVIVGGCYLI